MIIPAHTLIKDSLTINGDANLIGGNIKNGVSIFGVAGSLESAASKVAEGRVTPASGTTTLTFQHNFGVKPKSFIMSVNGGDSARARMIAINRNVSGLYDAWRIYYSAAEWRVENFSDFAFNTSIIQVKTALMIGSAYSWVATA